MRAIIDERVSRFSVEPIRGQWELLWLDKICLKVKEEQAAKDAVVLIAVGCNSHGQAKMLGFKLGECQAEVFSIAFLRELGGRGLQDIELLISDTSPSIGEVTAKEINAQWRHFHVDFIRGALAHAAGYRRLVKIGIQASLAQETPDEAVREWQRFRQRVHADAPGLAERMMNAESDVRLCMSIQRQLRIHLHSTDMLEQLHTTVERRAPASGVFANKPAIIRLIGSILLDQDDQWMLGRRAY